MNILLLCISGENNLEGGLIEVTEYRVVPLNWGLELSRDINLEIMEELLCRYLRSGWNLGCLLSPVELRGVIVAIFARESAESNTNLKK